QCAPVARPERPPGRGRRLPVGLHEQRELHAGVRAPLRHGADRNAAAGERQAQRRLTAPGAPGLRRQPAFDIHVGSTRRTARSSESRSSAAATAMPASIAKKTAWLVWLHSMPTSPAERLPAKIARYQAATVVAPSRGG